MMNPFLAANLISMLAWGVVFYLCFIRKTFSIKRLVFIPLLVDLVLIILAAMFFTEDKWLTIEVLLIHVVAIITASILFNYMLSNLEEDSPEEQ